MRFEFVFSNPATIWLIRVAFLCLLLIATQAPSFAAESKESGEAGQFNFSQPGLEFSIQVPPLWMVEEGAAGYAAVLKPSAKAPRLKLPGGVVADPTITIAASKKPIEFNQESLEKNAAEIEEKFIQANGSGTQFQIFQKNIIEDVANGRKGLLYYISYQTGVAEVAQAVLMTGHRSARYRITLSDHKANFDRNLELYYPYMVSIAFQTPPLKSVVPGLSDDLLFWGVGVVVAGALVGLVARLRRGQRWESPVIVRGRIPKSRLSAPPSRHSEESMSVSAVEQSHYPKTEFSQHPFSVNSLSGNQNAGSEFGEPAFSESDLSSPPQSIPLSQVVDESSAPPDLKKQWKIPSKTKDESGEPEELSDVKLRS